MRRLMLKLWKDDAGALIAVEWLFVATVLVIGMVAGLAVLRNHVVNEFEEFGNAVSGLNQCYSILGLSGCGGGTCGSNVTDTTDLTDTVKSSAPASSSINTTPCD